MAITVCLTASTLYYSNGGGHFWVYLNWALGLRALGCRVIWMECLRPDTLRDTVQTDLAELRHRLATYGLSDCVALSSSTAEPLPPSLVEGCLDLGAAAEADLLLNQHYRMSPAVVSRFRRSALLDIDPGRLQIWMSTGQIPVAPHDVYFTIGETVGQPGARFPDAGLEWQYTPPCVALDWWLPHQAAEEAPFTTVAHWHGGWMSFGEESYPDNKQSAFLPFRELPRHTCLPLELALNLGKDEKERIALQELGWRIHDSVAVASTPWDYQRYVQHSRGEFSCARPSCIRLGCAWISDRTLCYLASGKPAVVQHTGASRFLPDAAGLFRFRDLNEAVRSLETVAADYEHHCRLARRLAEEYFDARKVAGSVLERALV
jgi:hypothetical protein